MRILILHILLLILFASKCQSQDGLTFKVQYKPETIYTNTTEQTTFIEVKYSGSKELLQNLKDQGVTNPTITDKSFAFKSVFKTGKSPDGTNFPLTMEIVMTTSSDGKKDIPNGVLIYGHGSIGSMPTLDSIASNSLDEEFKNTLLQTMQSTFSQINIPERQVKVGESFSIETPLSIPIAGMTIEMIITAKYKLLKITNGVADFDVTSVYTMKLTSTKYTCKATGSGKGKLLYDVLNNYYLKYQSESEVKMNMKLDNFDLYLKTKSGFTQITEIAKNTSK